MVSASVGVCSFMAEDMRPSLKEKTSDIHDRHLRNMEPLIASSEVAALGKQFFLATAGAPRPLQSASTMECLNLWIADPLRANRPDNPALSLLSAIGSQARAQGPLDEHMARCDFEHGQNQIKSRLLGDLSVLTVQAHCLIMWYLITACRSNRATIELGVVAQAAFVLGIHKSEVNALFKNRERESREKAWKL
jgi:hypothetical protein